MGRGKQFSLHEIPETRASGQSQAFDDLIEKLKAAGAEITLDEEIPLYDDIGTQEVQLGTERIVEFSLNRTDFRLIRKTEEYRIDGAGRVKNLLKLDAPRFITTLKKKPASSNDWEVVDLEDLF